VVYLREKLARIEKRMHSSTDISSYDFPIFVKEKCIIAIRTCALSGGI